MKKMHKKFRIIVSLLICIVIILSMPLTSYATSICPCLHYDALLKYFTPSNMFGGYQTQRDAAITNWNYKINQNGASSELYLSSGTSSTRDFTISYTLTYPDSAVFGYTHLFEYDSQGNIIPKFIDYSGNWDFAYLYVYASNIVNWVANPIHGLSTTNTLGYITETSGHEIGHALGLYENNSDTSSIMYQGFLTTGPVITPSNSDVTDLYNYWKLH